MAREKVSLSVGLCKRGKLSCSHVGRRDSCFAGRVIDAKLGSGNQCGSAICQGKRKQTDRDTYAPKGREQCDYLQVQRKPCVSLGWLPSREEER